MGAPDQGTGTTVTFGAPTAGYTAGLPITNLAWSIEREPVETTHLGTIGARTFIPGDLITGTISMDCQLPADILETEVPWAVAESTISINWGGVTGEDYLVSGFVSAAELLAGSPNQLMTAALTWQCTSVITFPA